MKTILRKLMAILLAALTLIGSMPVSALAEGGSNHSSPLKVEVTSPAEESEPTDDSVVTLMIYYQYEDDTMAAPTYSSQYEKGASYSVPVPEISGYTATMDGNAVEGGVLEGTLTETKTITIVYVAHEAEYLVKHIFEQADGSTIIETETKQGSYGKMTDATARDVAGYHVDAPAQKELVPGTPIEIEIYYYLNEYYLSFDSMGGNYIDRLSLKHGASVSANALPEPERMGYDFVGWHTDASLSPESKVENELVMTAAIRLYASWYAGEAPFTVIRWVENADDTQYAYLDTLTKYANAGSAVQLDQTTADPIDHFAFERSEKTVVNVDGTSVLNVYYKRNSYTILWQTSGGTEILKHTGKYDSDIGAAWSDWKIVGRYPNCAWRSDVTGANYAFLPKMPGYDLILSLQFSLSGNEYEWYYYLELLDQSATQGPGGQPVLSDSGIKYYRWRTTTLKTNSTLKLTDTEDYFPITGFNRRDEWPGGRMEFGPDRKANLFYIRARYDLTFNNNGSITSEKVVYEKSIVDKNHTPSPPANLPSGAVFEGWYTSPEFFTGTEMKWQGMTMPAKNLILHAKWSIPTFTLTFDSKGGNAIPSQTMEHLSKAVRPADPEREGYVFDGWYTDETYRMEYDFEQEMTENRIIYAKWAQKTDTTYTVRYLKQGTEEEVFPAEMRVGRVGETVYAFAKTHSEYIVDELSKSLAVLAADVKLNVLTFYYQEPHDVYYQVRYVTDDANETLLHQGAPQTTSHSQIIVRASYPFDDYIPTQGQQSKILADETSEAAISKNVIVFRCTPRKISITVNKVWDDNEDMSGLRRDVDVTLNASYGEAQTATLTAAGQWKQSFTGLKYEPFAQSGKHDALISYTVEELTKIEGYRSEVNGYTIKNILDIYGYRIEYYYDSVLDDKKTETGTATIGSQIDAYPEKARSTDYLERVENFPLTIGATPDENVIRVYYAQKEALVLTADSGKYPYSGNTQEINTYSGAPQGLVVTGLTAYGAGKDVEKYPVTLTGTPVITKNGVDVTNQYLVTLESGLLEIEPMVIELTADSATKLYDGTALTRDSYQITQGSFAQGEGLQSVTVQGSQLLVGKSDNVITSHALSQGTNPGNYQIGYQPGTLEVTKGEIAITVTAKSDSKTYDGQPLTSKEFTVTGTLATGDAVEATVTGTITDVTKDGVPNVVSNIKVYNGTGGNRVDVTENYTVKPVNGKLEILPVSITLKADSANKTYDGQPLTANGYAVEGSFVGDQGMEKVTVQGAQLLVGSSDNTITDYQLKANTLAQNYAITALPGTLEVTKGQIPLTVTASSANKPYDGAPLSKNTFSVGGSLVNGDYVEAVVTGSMTDVIEGGVANLLSDIKVYRGMGTDKADVTENYVITPANGTLTITPMEIELTAKSDHKTYDGTPLTNGGYEITKGSFAPDQGLQSVTVQGSQLHVGSSGNEITSHMLKGNTKESNYRISYQPGTLTVDAGQIRISVEAKSDSKPYDGSALSANDFAVKGGLISGDYVEAVVQGTITNVTEGGVENMISNIRVYRGEGAARVEVTQNYVVTPVSGLLTITPIAVELTANSASKPYDGNEMTAPGYQITRGGFAGSEGVQNVVVEGSQLHVGQSNNVIKSYEFKAGTLAENYTVMLMPGTLNVTAGSMVITVTGGSADKPYDGTPLNADRFSVSGALAEGDYVEAVVTGEITNVTTGGVANRVSDIKVYRGEGAARVDVTQNYMVNPVNGVLKITPIEIELTASSDTKVYDGTALTNSGYAITSGVFVGDEGLQSVTVEGSRLYVGTAENTITSYTLQTNTLAQNYDISLVPGTLEITQASLAITVTAQSDAKVYDGTALTNGGYRVTQGILAQGDRVQATVTGTVTHVTAGGAQNVISDIRVYHDTGAGQIEVTQNYAITPENGFLTVAPVEIELTANSDAKTYDGVELVNKGYSITKGAFVGADGLESVTVEGSIILPGDTANTITAWTLNAGTRADNYTITPIPGRLVVTNGDIPLTVKANSDKKVYDGMPLTNGGYTLTNGALMSGDYLVVTVEGEITNATVGGAKNVVGEAKVYRGTEQSRVDVTKNYQIMKVDGVLTIEPAAVELTANSAEKTYDGTALTDDGYKITSGSFIGADGIQSATVQGSQLYAGSSDNVITAYELTAGTLAANYDISRKAGTLKILSGQYPITVSAGSATKPYDGVALGDETFAVSQGALMDGDYVEATVSGTITNVTAGGVTNTISSIRVYHGTGESKVEVTHNYAVTPMNGTLSITPIEVELTAVSDEKPYDGTELTNKGYDISKGGFVGSEGLADVTVEGSQLLVGESANTIRGHVLKQGTLAQNYVITYEPGTLKVTTGSIEITVQGDSQSKVYDGTPLSSNNFTVLGTMPNGDVVEAVVTGIIMDVTPGGVVNAVTEIKVYHGTGADRVEVTANYVITPVNGVLTITPALVELTANSDAKPYDGTALTNNGYQVTKGGFVGDEGLQNVTVTGSQLYVGSSANKITGYEWKANTKSANYGIDLKEGVLTISNGAIPVTITANSEQKTYDGTILNNTGFTLTQGVLANGDYVEADVVGAIKDVTPGGVASVVSNIRVYRGQGENRVDVTANYLITPVNGTLTILPVKIELTAKSDAKAYDGEPLSNSGYDVTKGVFVGDEGLQSVTVQGSQLLPGSGANTITAHALKTNTLAANYEIAYKQGTLLVTTGAIPVTISAQSQSKTYDGSPLSNAGFGVTTGKLAKGDYVEAVVTGSIINVTAGGAENKISEIKVFNGTGSQKTEVTANYLITPVDGLLSILPVEVELTAQSDRKAYDGTELRNAGYRITKGAFVGEEGLQSVVVEGGRLFVGSSENKITAHTLKGNTLAENYVTTYQPGTLEVLKGQIAITVTGDSNSKPYDGTPLQGGGFTVSGTMPNGDYVEAIVKGEITDVTAGGVDSVVTDIKVYRGQGADRVDVTENYVISTAPGNLTITPVAVELTANSDIKPYDGQPLTNNGYTITKGAFIGNEGLQSVTVEGSQLYAGSSDNLIAAYVLKANTKAENYTITPTPGKLTVQKGQIPITVSGASQDKPYDGTPLSNNSFTITQGMLMSGDVMEATVTGEITNVTPGGVANVVSDIRVYRGTGADRVEVTENYTFIPVSGALTITPVDIEITANSDSKAYDGTALENGGYTITKGAFVGGEGLQDVVVKGSQLDVGSSDNIVESWTLQGNTLAENYNIIPKPGTLSVSRAQIDLTVSADSATKEYDGLALKADSFTVASGTPAGADYVEAVVTGEMTNVTKGGVPNTLSNIRVYRGTGADRIDVTENYRIKAVSGLLTVTPVTVELTAKSDIKPYDGTALENSEFEITVGAFIGNEGIQSVTMEGSQLYAGTSANQITKYVLKQGTLAANYSIATKPGTLSVTQVQKRLIVNKSWSRPADVVGGYPTAEFTLLRNGVAIRQGSILNGQTQLVFDALDVSASSSEYVYTIEETPIPGYKPSIRLQLPTGETKVTDDQVYNVVNTMEELQITVNKSWRDTQGNYGTRPAKIEIALTRNGQPYRTAELTANANGNWLYTFTNLPKIDASGVEYTYGIEEISVDGYTTEYAADGYGLTNILGGKEDPLNPKPEIPDPEVNNPYLLDVNGTKTWVDSGLTDGHTRPQEITLKLYANGYLVKDSGGQPLQPQWTKGENEWTYVFSGLNRFKDGKEVTYSVKEIEIDGYKAEASGVNLKNVLGGHSGYNPENPGNVVTHPDRPDPDVPNPYMTSYTLIKRWDDWSNELNLRPMITAALYADGIRVREANLSPADYQGDEWTYTFTDLNKYANGREIVYSWREDKVYGYTGVTEGNVITNKLNTYTVYFVDWDGSILAAFPVPYLGSAPLPPSPMRDEHDFDGWRGKYEMVIKDEWVFARYVRPGEVIGENNIPLAGGYISNVGDCFD